MDDFVESRNTKFNPKLWGRALSYLKPLKRQAVFVALTMLLSAAVDAVVPLFMRTAVNRFVEPQSSEGLFGFTLAYIGVILFQALTTLFYTRQAMEIEMNVGRELKHQCFLRLQKLPLSFFNATPVGYILARVMSDTNRICAMVAWAGSNLIWNIFYMFGIIVSMFSINWRLALIVMAVAPLLVCLSLYFQPKLLKANRETRHVNSQITSAFNESVTGAKTIKTLAIEDKVTEEFKGVTSDMYAASLRAVRLNAVFVPLMGLLGTIPVALVINSGGGMALRGTMDLGVLSAFIAYSIAIMEPFTRMANFFSEVMAAQVNIERVMDLIDQPETIMDSPEIEEEYGGVFDPKPENWPELRGDIEFEQVWFRYPDADEDDYVLRDLSFKVKAGTTVAIVGETGAGKSTLVNLACRFFEPTRGRILIDGVDYRERGLIWLHSSLGYVQQTPYLFSGTLGDNIRYGKLSASADELERAAGLVSADVVASKLPEGYDTDVGEGGDRLSTGEKQLVSFARAIIADPPVFVLDEATSSIDTETEHLIQNAISHMLEGRTSFIIAHRLSTIRSADMIMLISGQGIKEQGSHEELMAMRGDYYNLYTAMMIKDESDELEGFRIS